MDEMGGSDSWQMQIYEIYGSQLLFHEEILTFFFMLKLCSVLDLTYHSL